MDPRTEKWHNLAVAGCGSSDIATARHMMNVDDVIAVAYKNLILIGFVKSYK